MQQVTRVTFTVLRSVTDERHNLPMLRITTADYDQIRRHARTLTLSNAAESYRKLCADGRTVRAVARCTNVAPGSQQTTYDLILGN